MIYDRRSFLSLGVALPFLARTDGVAAAGAVDMSFDVIRKGDVIGRHDVGIEPAAEGGQRIRTQIDIAVKVMFVTAFKYKLDAVERFADDRLIALESSLNDDGRKLDLEAWRDGEHLRFTDGESEERAPLGTMTDISFWNPDIVRQKRVLDVGKGRISTVNSAKIGQEQLRFDGRLVEARRYMLETENREGEVWYDQDGRWLKGWLNIRGEHLTYRPRV